MSWFSKKNKKNIKTIEAEFKRMDIGKWGDKYELEITYKAKVGENEFTQKLEKKFNSVEDALDYAFEYIVGDNWLKKGEDEAS